MTVINMTKNCVDHEFTPWATRPSKCLLCLRKYNSEYQKVIRNRIQDFLNDYRVQNGCVMCGYNSHYAALHFDHIIPAALGFRKKKRTNLPKSMAAAYRFVQDENIQD